jgi:light-harvesting complex I chlorophyll a/b binding protein 1
MAMASSSGLRSCSAVGVPSLLAPSSRSGRLPFCANATTSGRVITMSAEWMPGQPRPAHLDGSSPG